MGYGMCLSIHSKIPPDAQLFICDVNETVLQRFVEESPGKARVEILNSPKDIAEHCVSIGSSSSILIWLMLIVRERISSSRCFPKANTFNKYSMLVTTVSYPRTNRQQLGKEKYFSLNAVPSTLSYLEKLAPR